MRTREEAQLWQNRYGKVAYAGAWDDRWWHAPSVVSALPEGEPSTKPAAEDAVHFLLRMVHRYPHEVTIYEGGPMTNLALAISLDPQFAELADNPRHEFNFWFDPEAAYIVLRASRYLARFYQKGGGAGFMWANWWRPRGSTHP